MVSISAVIPAYNSEKFIFEPIESILAQTYEVAEIIVVDDGSSDRTAEVAATFPKTRVIRRPNGGQAAARNTGIQAAKGDWIALLDHDDVWLPHKNAEQVACITPDVGVIHANDFDPINFGTLWHRQAHITPSGTLIRKQALLDVGCFEETRTVMGVEDLTLWLKIALTDWRFVRSQSDVYQWRQTGANYSSNEFKMAQADLACITLSGARVSCQPEEIERVKRASRIDYAKNLIARQQWDEAAQLLAQSPSGLASRWLSLARLLRINRLARTNLVHWLQFFDEGRGAHMCSGECTLPEPQRRLCMETCRSPYHRPNAG